MTRAQKKSQLNKLKQPLGQHTQEVLLNNNSSNTCNNFDNSFDINFDATRDSSSAMDNKLTHDSSFKDNAMRNSSSKDKSNCNFDLPYNYLCGGLSDKLAMEALKELNIIDIKDFLNHNHDKSKLFEK